MESHSHIFNKPILDELQLIEKLIHKIAAPDKIIFMASNQILRRVIENIYLTFLVTLPYASNESRRCLRDKIENACLDHGLFVNVLAHTSAQLNNMLGQNSYFFYLIKKDCLTLYDSGNFPIADLSLATSEALKKQGENFLNRWQGMAGMFYSTAYYNFGRGEYRMAAFMLHQTLENIYTSIFLVFTGYRPAIHNLAKLRKSTYAFSPLFAKVFDERSADDMYLFSLVKNAYVSARYFEHYSITKAECQILMSRIKKLLIISRYVCKCRINKFGGQIL